MAPILPVILLASGFAFQTPSQTAPTTPSATTPAGSPLPSKGKLNGKAVNSELEGDTREDGMMSYSKYEGGSFSLKPNNVITYVNEKEVVVLHGKERFAIPVNAIAEVSDGSGVHARVGTATGSTVPNSNPKNNQTVVGIIWKDGDKKDGVVLRVDKGDFAAFVSALQTVTGLKATDAGAK
jgi:hypothetical protein